MDGISYYPSPSHIDRAWLETRIYMLETELNDKGSHGDEKVQITKLIETFFFNEYGNTSEHSLFLGEASQCSWIVRTKPFPWSPRVPKTNEIFQFSAVNHALPKLESDYKGTFTSPP